jgi:hypothetical protein
MYLWIVFLRLETYTHGWDFYVERHVLMDLISTFRDM